MRLPIGFGTWKRLLEVAFVTYPDAVKRTPKTARAGHWPGTRDYLGCSGELVAAEEDPQDVEEHRHDGAKQ